MLGTISSIRRDLTHAVRSLAKEWAFTLVCVISLGIGVGAFLALVTLNRVVTAPARNIKTAGLTELLVLPSGPLRAKAGVWALEPWSYPDYRAMRDGDLGLAVTGWARDVSEFGTPAPDQSTPLPRATTLYVSANYFQTFGVALAQGPGFDAAIDDTPAGEPRVVLSHDFWKSRVAGDPAIIGKSLTFNGVAHTVVGIAPEGFHGHFHFFQAPGSLVFIPLERHPRLQSTPLLRDDRATDWVHIHARLNDGVTLKQANERVIATMANIAQRFPATNEFKSATVEPYASMGAAGRPDNRGVISILLSLAGAVLLIVCLNISGMMLVRGASRERELSIRAALGADRGRLVQHLFLEAVLLAFAGGALSALVLFGIPAVVAWYLNAPVPEEIDFDAVSVAISTGLCLLVSVLFGLLPALRFSRPNLVPALKEDAGGGRRHTIRVHRIAAMIQIGIAIPFLVISGVMFDRARTAEFGFETRGLAATRLPAPKDNQRTAGFSIQRIRDGVRQASGVRLMAVADGMPIDFDYRLSRVGRPDGADFVTAQVTRVGENFLETIGATLRRGRTITAEDGQATARVAVISQPLADRLFPSADPIGKPVSIALDDERDQTFTVVGVTADFATSQLTTERPQVLLPLPNISAETRVGTLHLIVRGAPGDEPKLRGALENVLRELGVEPLPGIAFPGIVTGEELVQKSIEDLISESIAVAVVGGVVLVLAALGIVGVVGFMVATRTRELALRMALGSSRFRVFRLMLSDTVKLVIPGVVGGLLLGAVLIRWMVDVMGTPLTVGPTPLGVMEPIIYTAASAIAVSVALVAGLPAARRATSVPPMTAMRAE